MLHSHISLPPYSEFCSNFYLWHLNFAWSGFAGNAILPRTYYFHQLRLAQRGYHRMIWGYTRWKYWNCYWHAASCSLSSWVAAMMSHFSTQPLSASLGSILCGFAVYSIYCLAGSSGKAQLLPVWRHLFYYGAIVYISLNSISSFFNCLMLTGRTFRLQGLSFLAMWKLIQVNYRGLTG